LMRIAHRQSIASQGKEDANPVEWGSLGCFIGISVIVQPNYCKHSQPLCIWISPVDGQNQPGFNLGLTLLITEQSPKVYFSQWRLRYS
jgi:hypothetical protein